MNFYRIFRIFKVMSVCADWFEKAMQDGKIDSKEAGQLVTLIAGILGFKITLEVNPNDPL